MTTDKTVQVDSSRLLIVFARYPDSGRVKTRLARSTGDAAAREIYRSFTDVIVGNSSRIKGVAIRLDVDPGTDACKQYFSERYPRVEAVAQKGGGLGERMLNSFAFAFGSGYSGVCLIGTDSPDLPSEIISDAFEALSSKDIVLGPSSDGGYYLIGMEKAYSELFEDIAWSTDAVFAETLDRAAALGLSLTILPRFSDVDTIDDLARLYERIDCKAEDDVALCKLKDNVKRFLPDVNSQTRQP